MVKAITLESGASATGRPTAASPTVSPAMAAAIDAACGRIAPLWPLGNFVAVNPFLGFSERSFQSTAATFRRVTGVETLMPRAYFRQALADGRMTDADLAAALDRLPDLPGRPADVGALRLALQAERAAAGGSRAVVATVAEVLDSLSGGDREASRTAFMIDEISRWCAAYFDEGQAPFGLPGRDHPPYAAWRWTMRFDRNPEVFGIGGFRSAVADLPEDPRAAIAAVVVRLGIPDRAVEDYLFRALFDIGGWAAYVRQLGWNAALDGRRDDRLVDLLAIRVVWGFALFLDRQDEAFRSAWSLAMAAAADLPSEEREGSDPELAVDLVCQTALEIAHQRRLFGGLAASAGKSQAGRPEVQAAFCIDVRSEVYRRALETVSPSVQTIGFAGFFGFPIEYVPIGQSHGRPQCPVLLKPAVIVCEAVTGAAPQEEETVMKLRQIRRRVARTWKAFKTSAVSSFTFVEAAGLGFAAKLVGDAAGLTRPVPHPHLDGLDRPVLERVGPRLAPAVVGGRATGFPLDRRIAMAEAVLTAMSLRSGFARLVLLAGHGSSTVNNPHASGLDCGACGGHTGEANARVAAGILNDPDVRAGLAARGIEIPSDTRFVAALHDTTTDEVTLYDLAGLGVRDTEAVERLRGWLAAASGLARTERAAGLGIGSRTDVDAAVIARSRDWSQVRPEWGLAGNAAFIAAPRERTEGLDLAGRCFLHSYDHREDEGYRVLELIMTAPMVVASWINLQYYGSTVDNRAFGSGNKTLHNVVGTLGVLEGNAGDLRTGLPLQSVHDGSRIVHEPLRLTVVIEAPMEAIDGVLERNGGVADLVRNGWIHLFALADAGELRRRTGSGWSRDV